MELPKLLLEGFLEKLPGRNSRGIIEGKFRNTQRCPGAIFGGTPGEIPGQTPGAISEGTFEAVLGTTPKAIPGGAFSVGDPVVFFGFLEELLE